MPWSNGSTGGSGQDQRGPWGGGPSGGGGTGGKAAIEAWLKRGWDNLKDQLPKGRRERTMALAAAGAGLLALWLLSGIYFVSSHETGIVLRFGKVVRQSEQGINYHLPWPFETPEVVDLAKENQLHIGFVQSADASDPALAGDVPGESLMLTDDGNIVDVNFTVFWVVKDATAFLFNVENARSDPNNTIKAVGESAMRAIIARTKFDGINQSRDSVQSLVRDLMQKTLDLYGAGIAITNVKLGPAFAPARVSDSFRDVQAAESDRQTARVEAQGAASKIVLEAKGQAARIVEDAKAYHDKAIAEATGKAKSFLALDAEYKKAPEVTKKRIYLETMSQILGPMNKVIVDDSAGRNVVPYLQLPDFPKNRTETVTVTPQTGSQLTAGPQ